MQSFTVCFLLPLILNVHADVVKNFQDKPCNQYFYKGKEPQVQSSTSDVHICQTFQNTPRFATLYDTANRIPVYSAYLHEKTPGTCNWEGRWFIEPKLVNNNWERDMMWEADLGPLHPGVPLGDRQALDTDYIGVANYNRGHLNPNQHHADPGCRATYTLTNIAPQNIRLNGGPWETYENDVHRALRDCKTAYVLVGAIPSPNHWIVQNNQNRVNIPAYFWHTYCCVQDDGNFMIGAAAVRNEDMNVQTCSFDSLKKFFTKVKSRIHLPFLDSCTAKGKKTTDVSDGDCTTVVPNTQ